MKDLNLKIVKKASYNGMVGWNVIYVNENLLENIISEE